MKRKQFDLPFFFALIILIAFGLLMVFSASMYTSTVESETSRGYNDFLRQAIFAGAGIILMIGISFFDYRRLRNKYFVYALMIASGALLILVLLFGTEVNGAKRWIFGIQPSEIAKMVGILYMSAAISWEPKLLEADWKEIFVKCMLPIGALFLLTAVEPSLSAALAIAFGMIAVLFFGGIRFSKLLPYGAAAFGALALFMVIEPWRMERLAVLFGKGSVDYQISQSLLAIGSGGIIGKGLGNGQQKFLFLPELQNDFIFANIGEEFGLIGCVAVIALFGFIIWRGFRIAYNAPDRFSYLFTSAVMLLLGFQVFVNIGVAIKVLPVTGMALPFVSSGGSSIVILCATMGVILNISRHVTIIRRKNKEPEEED